MENVEYILWIMPTGATYQLLKSMSENLSRKYNTPEIDPHVTVEGGIYGDEDDIVRKTSLFASSIHPYSIHLARIGYTDSFFRALFYRATQTSYVREANRKAREIFDIKDGPYMPHLSILYGNIPLEEKKRIISGLPRNLNVSFDVDVVHLYAIENQELWKPRKVKEFALG